MEKNYKKLMIQKSCIAGGWIGKQSQIDKTLQLGRVFNWFLHHLDATEF